MQPPEIWTLINLFRMATKITSKLPVMCKFIRKSYRPLAEAVGEAISADYNHYYPKIYKYAYSQAKVIQAPIPQHQEQNQNIQYLLEEMKSINTDLTDFYGSLAARHNQNIIEPKLINPNGKEFDQLETILEVIEQSEYTPKFHTLSRNTIRTEEQDEAQQNVLNIFRDMSN